MNEPNDAVLYELNDGVATITLNRPESLNSMNDELMLGLNVALQRVVDDPEVRVVVLTGAGRGFCSGADLSTVGDEDDAVLGGAEGMDLGEATAAGMDDIFHPPIRLLSELPVPSVARINGVAAGGGLGLALGCDIAVAARSAKFVCTFGPRLGIVPDLGTTFHLAHKAGATRARAIAMLGRPITADQAVEWGLILTAVDDEGLDAEVADITASLARSSPDAMRRIRQAVDAAERNTLDQQLDLERDHQRVLIPKNMEEGAAAFLAKREPVFDAGR